MPSVKSAGDVSEKTRTLVARQRDTEEPRDRLTSTGDSTLDFLHDRRIYVHLQCLAYLRIDDKPVDMNFSRRRLSALHRSAHAVAPLRIAKVRNDENSTQR